MKKQRFLFTLLMAIVMMAISPQKVWALGGSGTSSDPFTISNENDLFDFADRVNNRSYGNSCFKLVANITLTKAWTPIGTSSNPYTATFDGNNKTISGLNLTATAANAGFFGYVNGATIKNFSLAGSISSGYDNTGSVVGSADGATKIYNVYSSVNITMTAAKSHIGGIAGQLLQENSKVSEIKGCAYSGTMNLGSSTDSNGGIVGYCEKEANVQIEYCFFSGSISSSGSTPRIGGILGYADDENSQNFNYIRNCYCDGTLSPSSGTYVGAIAGYPRGNVPGVITNNTYKSGMATNALGNSKTSSTSTPIKITLNAGTGGKVTQTYVNPTSTTATQLQVVATPSAHYHFGSWSDSGAQTHSVGLTANVSLTASFAVDQHQITVKTNNSDYGTVTGGGTFDYGSTKTITATAKAHYHFVEWSDGNTNASRTITVTGDKTYTATFAIDQFTITVKTNDSSMGTVSGGGTFDYNSTKTITATPKAHYHFVQWNDGNTNASRTITVTENKTYTASFAIDQHTITVQVFSSQSSWGTVSGGGTYDYGTQQTILATPKTGYHFYMWSDYNTDATRTITVTEDKTYKAMFDAHVFGEWITDVPATCTNTGTKHRNCKHTGCNAREDGTIPATGHSFGEWITDTPATCIAEGTKHRDCTHAGCDERENGIIEMVAHTCSDFDANGFGECSVCHAEQYERPERDGNIWQIRNAGQLYYYADIVNKYHLYLDRVAELRNDIVVNDGTFDADGNFTPTGSSTTSTPRSWTPIGDVDNNREVYIEGYGHTISGLYFNDENRSAVGFVGRGAGSIKNLGVVNCYFKGYGSVGGICGWNRSYDIKISNCYVTGRICGVNTTGGLMGFANEGASISRCWSDCIVTGTGNYVGGFCGVCLGVVEDCYSKGTVNGTANYVGGFCGRIPSTSTRFGTIRNCYTTTTVSGESVVGSICGINDAGTTITNCYSTNTTLPAIAQNDGTALYCESNVSAERFASGEITWRLNGNTDGTSWYQNLSDGTLQADAYPVTIDTHRRVYYQVDKKCDGTVISEYYTNTPANTIAIHQPNEGGTCSVCGSTGDVKVVLADGVLTFYKDLIRHEGKTFELNKKYEYPGWSPDSLSITKAVFDASFASVRPTTCYWWFGKCRNMTSIEGMEYLNTEEATELGNLFRECRSLTSIDLSHINTENATGLTGLSAMFRDCNSLQTIDVSTFNTENVENMSGMFRNCSSLQSIDLSNFNTEKVTHMEGMFAGCTSLTSLDLSNFNCPGLECNEMFMGCSSLETLSIGNIGYVSSTQTYAPEYLLHMFDGCDKLTTLNIKSIPCMTQHPDFKQHPWTTVNYLLDDNSYIDDYGYTNQMPAATSVHYTRTLEAGKTVTFILPFDMPVDNVNGKVYELTDFDGEVLTFSEPVDGIAHANKPYLLRETAEGNLMKAPIGSYKFDIPYCYWWNNREEIISTVAGDASMVGAYYTYKNLYSTAEQSIYGYGNGELVRQLSKEEGAHQGATIKPFRALIRVKEPDGASYAKARLALAFDEETSGVISIDDDELNNKPVNVYDLNGRIVRANVNPITCLQGLPEGIYIVDGQRIMKRGEAQQGISKATEPSATATRAAAAEQESVDGVVME